MSSEDELSNELSRNDVEDLSEDEEEQVQRTKDDNLMEAVYLHDTAGVQQALQSGANVNCFSEDSFATPLISACREGYAEIVRILLDAGADPWWKDRGGLAGIFHAVENGHFSIVEMLLNHDNDLLEIANNDEETPLVCALIYGDFEIAHLLLERGANALVTDEYGSTALILCCQQGADLDVVRQLLAAASSVDARDMEQDTALHYAARDCTVEIIRELVVEHNANILAVDDNEKTPFDFATNSDSADGRYSLLIESYGNILAQDHGRLALHAVLAAAEYSFAENYRFHPPLNPLRIRLPLGKLTLDHFRTLLSTLGIELIHNRDDSGMLPIHFACQVNAPVEVLSLLTEMDPTTLQIADYSGALPMHSLFYSDHPVEYASVQYLVEQSGVGTLAARNQDGAMPLHVLCGSQNPSLRTVQYMIQSFSGSVAAQTNSGRFPFMIAAGESSTASLSVVYELVRTSPILIYPNT